MQFNKDSVTWIFHNVNLIGSSPSPVPTALLLGSSNERSQKCSSSRVKSRGSKHAMMERSHQGGKKTLTPSSEGWWDMIPSRKEVHVEANCWKWPWSLVGKPWHLSPSKHLEELWESCGILQAFSISLNHQPVKPSTRHHPNWERWLCAERMRLCRGPRGKCQQCSSSRLWEFYKDQDNITYFIRAWLQIVNKDHFCFHEFQERSIIDMIYFMHWQVKDLR